MNNYLIIAFIIVTSILLIILLVALIVILNKRNKKTNQPVVNFTKVESISELKEDESSTNDLEQLLKRMEEDLEKQSTIDPVTAYEQEQEEKAIISYQELLATKEQENVKQSNEQLYIDAEKKFKNTDFISPIYGKQEINITYPKVETFERNKSIDFDNYIEEKKQPTFDLEKTLNITPITEEIKKSEDFLSALKDFRNNL